MRSLFSRLFGAQFLFFCFFLFLAIVLDIAFPALLQISFPIEAVILFALLVANYAAGPWLARRLFKIQWCDPHIVEPRLAEAIEAGCAAQRTPFPRFGVVQNKSVDVLAFGHRSRDACLIVTTGLLEWVRSGRRVDGALSREIRRMRGGGLVIAAMLPLVVPGAVYLVLRLSLRMVTTPICYMPAFPLTPFPPPSALLLRQRQILDEMVAASGIDPQTAALAGAAIQRERAMVPLAGLIFLVRPYVDSLGRRLRRGR